jgi:ubiquinone/menaquinone biosynthesis C-methylase UbiE
MKEIDVQNEKEFHNRIFETQQRQELEKYYSFTQYIYDNFHNSVTSSISKDSFVLEYGCGMNTYINTLAAATEHRFAFDISDFAIEHNNKVFPSTQYIVADAHKLSYADNYFDVVFGTSILHHLDLKIALPEIARVMKLGGEIIFLEPLGHNYFINKFRQKTPEQRTSDEHPLVMKDMQLIEKYFSLKETRYYCLMPLFVFAAFKEKAPKSFFNIAKKMDAFLFKIFPFFKRYSWIVVLKGKKK